MKIWVTGSKGMLGSALLERCRKKGIEAVGTGRAEADIGNLDQLKEKVLEIRPTHIVNCAAYTDVDGAEMEPGVAFRTNAEGAANVALAAREGSARLVQISTDYVFDGRGTVPYREADLCAPANVYGKSKWEGEKRVLAVLPMACILRSSWLFGLKGKNFISSLLKWFQQKEELEVVFDQCGRPTYCHDLAEAVINVLNTEGVIHFANGGERSRYQIALDLRDAARKQGIWLKCQRILPVPSAQFPTLAVRPLYSVLDTSKYFHLTSIEPRPWSEAVNEFLNDAL
jgi:dTDP-4-dehydrorhamnose reductase